MTENDVQGFLAAVENADLLALNTYYITIKDIYTVKNAKKNNRSALCDAIDRSNGILALTLTVLLINMGFDVNQPDDLKKTPIFYAVQQNNFLVVEKLISTGAYVKQENING